MVSSEACGHKFTDSLASILKHFFQMSITENALFSGSLQLDEFKIPGHDKIQINLGILILEIIEIQKSLGSHNPHAHSGDLSGDGAFRELSLLNKTVAG